MSLSEPGRHPVSQTARDRLRAQARRERDLATRVLTAQARLTAELTKRAELLAARDRVLAARRDDVADALIAYVDEAGVRVERAALIVGQQPADVARLVNGRRAALRRNQTRGPA